MPNHRASTFAEYAGVFLAGYSRANGKASEQRHKEWAFRDYLIPILGSRRLADLDRSDGEALKVELERRGLASKSANNILTMAKTMLNLAVDDDLIPKNPWQRVRHKRLVKNAGWSYWTAEESHRFLDQAQRDFPAFYPIFLTLLRTGVRIGEAAGLFWEDVDFAEGKIRLRRQYSSDRIWGTLKDLDERTVGLSPQLAVVLRQHQAATFLLDAITVKIGDHTHIGRLVFVNRKGEPVTSDTIKKARDIACRRAGVRRIRVHDFRHTVATLLRRVGVSCEDIAELFGHADAQMTQRHTHNMPEVRLRTVHLLDDAAQQRPAIGMSAGQVVGLLDDSASA
jgi:integrase